MTITELIDHLSQLRRLHGDVEVETADSNGSSGIQLLTVHGGKAIIMPRGPLPMPPLRETIRRLVAQFMAR